MYCDSCIARSTGRIALYFEKLEPLKAFENPAGLARLLIFLYLEESGTDHGIIAAFDSSRFASQNWVQCFEKSR